MFGRRLRIGLMVPSSNTTMEPEFYQHLPEGVSLHTARMNIVQTTYEGLKAMSKDVERCARLVATAGVNVVCYGCTTGSLLEGKGYDTALVDRIGKIVQAPVVATAPAVVETLRGKGMKRLAIVTPYVKELDEREAAYLEDYGFEVLTIKGLGIVENLDIGKCEPSVAFRMGLEAIREAPKADGVFISCTNFRSFGIIQKLSEEIGKPVVSSNQASLWMTLKTGGVSASLEGLEC